MLAAFEAEYRRIYGLTIPDIGIEVVTWRLAVVADAERVDPGLVPVAAEASPSPSSTRPVVFGRGGVAVDTPVYQRASLGAGSRFTGPAIVEERETTAVIRPGWSAEVGPDGSIIATRTTAALGGRS